MLETIGYNAERQGLDTGNGLDLHRTVGENSWQIRHLCDPATIRFAFDLDRVSHERSLTHVAPFRKF